MTIDRRILTGGFSVLAMLLISGCSGGSSAPPPPAPPPPPPPPDITAPTVSAVQAPAGTANRTVTLTLTASDNVGVSEVRFFVDGVLLGSDSTAPYSFDWDTSTASEGDHMLTAEASDAAGNVGQSAAVIVTVRNIVQLDVTLGGNEEVPAVDTQATGQASFTVNLVSGDIQGSLLVSNLVATAAHIHNAFAGTSAGVLVGLVQDAVDPALFALPAGAALDAAGIDRLLEGRLYVNAHSMAYPGGEIRGQILPEGFVLRFTDLNGANQVPQVETVARGRAAVTLNQLNGALVVQAMVNGLDNATMAHVHTAYAGANGPVLVPLSQDTTNLSRWFAEGAVLNAAGLDAFAKGRLYVNVHSPDNPGGEIRGQVIPAGITLITTELSGEQEVPVVDTSANGVAALTLDEAGALLTLHVNTRRLTNASASHLHAQFAGINGPVDIGLTLDGSDPSHFFVEERALTATQLDALLAGGTYVNVHSPTYPGGEIRGQVIPDGILFAFGRLDGNQRVPVIATTASGVFAVTIDPLAATLVAHANTTDIVDPVAAHFHDGYAGTNGGVVIPLMQDTNDDRRWSAVNVAITADQLTALRAGRYYINVHTQANPGGEIRGQVALSPVEVLFTQMNGDEEVPAVPTVANAIAASTVNRDTGALTLHVRANGADDATGSHIHGGFAGQNGPVEIGLQEDLLAPGHWSVSGAQFDSIVLADYLAGRLYVNLHTPLNQGGEIRGQIAPRDIQVVFSPMNGDQVVPAVATAASGLAATTTDVASRRLVAFINAVDVDDATSAGIHRGGLGENGAEVLMLLQTPTVPGQWSAIIGQLDNESFNSYRAGRLYAQIATPAEMNGEIRGQVVPPNAADFDDQAPDVTLMVPASPVSGSVTLDADASDDQGVVEVRFLAGGVLIGADATAPYSINWDTTTVADGQVTLTAEAEDSAGNVGVSANVVVTVQNGSPVTLTQIQTQVFTPICSACHSGPTSNVLPSGMNLSNTASSFAALVNVASLQVGTIDRVEPGLPNSSYLIQKLEGNAAVGTRMPQNGPFLDQATVDMIRQWISDGAANN